MFFLASCFLSALASFLKRSINFLCFSAFSLSLFLFHCFTLRDRTKSTARSNFRTFFFVVFLFSLLSRLCKHLSCEIYAIYFPNGWFVIFCKVFLASFSLSLSINFRVMEKIFRMDIFHIYYTLLIFFAYNVYTIFYHHSRSIFISLRN